MSICPIIYYFLIKNTITFVIEIFLLQYFSNLFPNVIFQGLISLKIYEIKYYIGDCSLIASSLRKFFVNLTQSPYATGHSEGGVPVDVCNNNRSKQNSIHRLG